MKKITVVLFAMFLLGVTNVFAATNNNQKVTNTRTVQATQDTTLTFGKLKFFVPAGQNIELAELKNGVVLLHANKMDGIKVNNATLSAPSSTVLSIDPKTNAVIVEQGKAVLLTDKNGRTATMSQGAAVSGNDIRQSVERAWPVTFPVSWQIEGNIPQNTDKTEVFVPAFVAEDEVAAAAREQATQDVLDNELREEDTLSPSAPNN